MKDVKVPPYHHKGIKNFMIPFMTHLIMEDMVVEHATCGEKNI